MRNLYTRPFTTSALITITLLKPVAVAARFTIRTPKIPKINKSICRHSASFTALGMLCVALVGCSLMKPSLPPTEKLRATLDKVIKKDSPDATYSITSSDVHSSQKLISVKINFEHFTFTDEAGKERDFSSGKATASFDYRDGKWILSSLQTSEPETVLLLPDLPVE